MNSNDLFDVVAGLFQFVDRFLRVVMAARFEVELDTADLDGVFDLFAIAET